MCALAGARAPGRVVNIRIAPAGRSVPARLAAGIRCIDVDDAIQQAVLVFHHAADALAEKPRGLLADAQMLGQLTEEIPLLLTTWR